MHIVRLLAFLVHHNDDHQKEDLCQNPQQRPERCQVAANSEHRDHGGGADHVCGVALVVSRVLSDIQVDNAQFGVVVFVVDEKTSRGVINILQTEGAAKGKSGLHCKETTSTYPSPPLVITSDSVLNHFVSHTRHFQLPPQEHLVTPSATQGAVGPTM